MNSSCQENVKPTDGLHLWLVSANWECCKMLQAQVCLFNGSQPTLPIFHVPSTLSLQVQLWRVMKLSSSGELTADSAVIPGMAPIQFSSDTQASTLQNLFLKNLLEVHTLEGQIALRGFRESVLGSMMQHLPLAKSGQPGEGLFPDLS